MADLSNNTFATVRGRNSQEVTENLKEGTCHKDDDCLQQLHKILIDPIAKHLPSNPEEEIVIIPDGELFKVPFAALKNNNNQYLIENHTLRVAPSIQLLKFTAQQQAKQTPKTSQTALIVGNPEMPRGNNNQRLAALPGTQQEAYAIAELLDTTPLIGERATEWRVKNNIEDADIIHLATHGDPTSLVFASSSSNDGFLRDGEIYGLDLQANLVVLSACETGLGEITSDGIVGISRPFIAAGVPSVVMSLWLVPDAATSELMIDFHKNLQTGQNKAQALRQAMLSTMKTNPDPVNWAGFILVGESDPIQ
ncbi:CHAT domain-containing protein [Crocosphaera watsonii]|uniref:CHAT domain-containing protein n=1 Tax=Crocosphaera watsonii TaxID=263511 RepID=UPI0022835B62|nr:CHAT domain-containing protein [Crocosphaera watsonii]